MDIKDFQAKLMPFLITVISLLAVVYLVFFFLETNDIQNALAKPPIFQESITLKNNSLNEKKWDNLYTLEQFALSNRYYHARLIVRSRILIISLSFLTGITLSIIGAIFILSKYSEKHTEIGAGNEKLNVKLVSSSPGIILSFLGIVLISISVFSKTNLSVIDSPIYIPDLSLDTIANPINLPITNKSELEKRKTVNRRKKEILDSLYKEL